VPESFALRQRPLSHLGLAGRAQPELGRAGLGLIERDHRALVDLRVDPKRQPGALEAVGEALGVTPPTAANTAAGDSDLTILWLGPNEWLVVRGDPAPEAGPTLVRTLRQALSAHFAAVVDVSGANAAIGVTGPQCREVLERAVPLDMHARVFTPGQVKQTAFGRHCGATLHLLDEGTAAAGPVFDLYCRRSFAEYVWRYLEDCAVGAETRAAVLEA
jgi:sarcosine oxidase subunit gamma